MTTPTPAPASPSPRASVVVVADGPWDDTFRCLAALARGAAGVDHEVIVVDDGTADETAMALPRLPGVTSLRGDAPQGFAAAAQAGLLQARAPLVAFLHADAEPHPGWLEPLVRLAEDDERVAAVASRLVAPTGLVEADGVALAYASPYPITPIPVGAGEPAVPSAAVTEIPAASGAALLVRKAAFEAAGGFDPAYAGPAADLDLCLRLGEAGGLVLAARASVAVHHGRCSGEVRDEDAVRLTRRWLGRVPLFDPDAGRADPVPPPREGRPPLAVLVPVRDALATIAPCLEALWHNLGPEDRLVVADAGSQDGTREYLALLAAERGDRIQVLDTPAGDGLAGAARAAAAAAGRPLAVLVQPLAAVPPGFLDALTKLLEEPEATAVVALPAPPAGLCVAGASALLERVAAEAPDAFADASADLLERALAPLGASLGIVEQAS